MEKTFAIAVLFIGFLSSCSNPKPQIVENFAFAISENLPYFEEIYLYDFEERKSLKLNSNQTEWYLVDWNKNGIFNEVGIDYFGVKSPFKGSPIIALLENESFLNHNGNTYSIKSETDFYKLEKVDLIPNNKISYISNYIPIELTDGTRLKTDLLEDYDKTVFYFWATWCSPCIEKLEEIETSREKLKTAKINFVPIYYKSSLNSVLELNKAKGFNFEPKEMSEVSALNYQISSLPQTFVFDHKGQLISETFKME